jgi:hypothetical protein
VIFSIEAERRYLIHNTAPQRMMALRVETTDGAKILRNGAYATLAVAGPSRTSST